MHWRSISTVSMPFTCDRCVIRIGGMLQRMSNDACVRLSGCCCVLDTVSMKWLLWCVAQQRSIRIKTLRPQQRLRATSLTPQFARALGVIEAVLSSSRQLRGSMHRVDVLQQQLSASSTAARRCVGVASASQSMRCCAVVRLSSVASRLLQCSRWRCCCIIQGATVGDASAYSSSQCSAESISRCALGGATQFASVQVLVAQCRTSSIID